MDALVAVAALGLMVALLGTIIRFTGISSSRTRGDRNRLREPDPSGVAGLCGFQPPPDLVELFRAAPFIERVEFQLVDDRQRPAAGSTSARSSRSPRGTFGRRAVHGVRDGIPIADDGDKGSYVVLSSGAVVLRSPDVPGREVPVAGSADELKTFSPADDG